MAEVGNSVRNKGQARVVRSRGTAFGFALAGWFIPGLGQVLAGRWGRGIVFFCAVASLVLTGYFQRGFVFAHQFGEPFGMLGFLADASTGLFYFVSKVFETNGPNIARAAGDYGTRFIATAGMLNLLAAFDAYAVAIGERD
ncbi:MAG TPA: DUF6677 family protein [Candidatus Dormibacteraeota bacterium]|nr:DUF6677 family protein [Candidatus Dormibacteraeota bacterium]